MNYMPSGAINQTSCKECIFALYENNTQIGCDDNRIEKFKDDVIEAYDDDKEFFVINRTCTLYRNLNWNSGKKDLLKAKEESKLKFDVLINCNNITEDMAIYIINFISNTSDKNNVKLFYSYNSSPKTKELITKIIFTCPKVQTSIYLDKNEYIYHLISKTQNSLHTIIDETNYIGIEKFILQINKIFNEDLDKGIIFSSNNKIAILTLACKLLYPNLYLNYSEQFPEMEQKIKEGNLYIEF